jgi:CheY-like chemotaxis protein
VGDAPILIAEDDRDVREAIVAFLHLLGVRTVEAENGEEVLRQVREGETPCLVLLDLMMPVMDGWEVCVQMKRTEMYATIPVILLSAHPDTVRAGARLGAAGALRKPVDPVELEQVVRKYCPTYSSSGQ